MARIKIPTMTSPAIANLELRNRRFDIVLAVVFAAFAVTSVISDLLPTVGVTSVTRPPNFFVQLELLVRA